MSALPPTSRAVATLARHGEGMAQRDRRTLPEETPVAIVYNGTTQAVMMATPADLEDFATGFALSDHAITACGQIRELEIVPQEAGIEARLWFDEERTAAIEARRRHMAGPVGCGLCGIDSLAEALHPIAPLGEIDLRLAPGDLPRALDALRDRQPLHDETHAVHAAGLFQPFDGIRLAREDVGRHNALDKLLGAMARQEIAGKAGAIALTSRISVDLVQKCAVARVPVLIAVSAPTAHAVRLAEAAGITLASVGRRNRIDVFTHADRIETGAVTHVA
jgi:FdhD protein